MKKWLYILGVGLFLTGCATEQTKEGLSPEDLYSKGYEYFQKQEYETAAEYFDEVEKQHPYSIWSERAQIMAAYSYYQKNKYDDAILALDRFIQLHPGNRNTPYAYYLKGLCFYEQMSDAEREQSMTKEAQDTFNNLIARYPDTVYAKDARTKMQDMTNHLAAQDMAIGRYYLKQHDLIPAINRFKSVIDTYPDSNQVPEAYYRLVTSYTMLGMNKGIKETYTLMEQKFPKNKWTQKAKKLMEKNGV